MGVVPCGDTLKSVERRVNYASLYISPRFILIRCKGISQYLSLQPQVKTHTQKSPSSDSWGCLATLLKCWMLLTPAVERWRCSLPHKCSALLEIRPCIVVVCVYVCCVSPPHISQRIIAPPPPARRSLGSEAPSLLWELRVNEALIVPRIPADLEGGFLLIGLCHSCMWACLPHEGEKKNP